MKTLKLRAYSVLKNPPIKINVPFVNNIIFEFDFHTSFLKMYFLIDSSICGSHIFRFNDKSFTTREDKNSSNLFSIDSEIEHEIEPTHNLGRRNICIIGEDTDITKLKLKL